MEDKYAKACSILQRLHSAGYEAYFAGGCVRDRLRGMEPSDFDIATSALPEQVQALFPKTVAIGAAFGVILVVEDSLSFEVATFRTEGGYQDGRRPTHVKFAGVREDASRRDFTVNGLYFDTVADQVLDYVGGEADLHAKVIRTIGEPDERFGEDHLRLLRAVRFAVQLGFEIDPKTYDSILRNHATITRVSWERIRDEFCKILTSPDPERGLRLLDETKLLGEILPEAMTMKGVEQPPQYHPEGDVFVHTLLLMKQLKNAPIELAMGALLHDIAKPETFVRAADRIRFHGHDTIGAERAEEICRRMIFPNDQMKLIRDLVKNHLRFKDAFQMKVSTLKRFLGMERFDLHLELHRIDCLASHGLLDAYHFCKEKYEEYLKEPPPQEKLITGEDLKAMGFKPGPQFGEILRELEDGILEGRIKTRHQAEEWVRKNYQKHD